MSREKETMAEAKVGGEGRGPPDRARGKTVRPHDLPHPRTTAVSDVAGSRYRIMKFVTCLYIENVITSRTMGDGTHCLHDANKVGNDLRRGYGARLII
jgi:hypothetical protein